MSPYVVRVWLLRDWSEKRWDAWHVSIGNRSPLRDLRRLVAVMDELGLDQSPGFDCPVGMTWDEALAAWSVALIAPGSLGPRRVAMEHPGSDWELIAECSPSEPGCGFDVASREERWAGLDLGEALATLTRLTFPVDWIGFHGDRSSYALVRREVIDA